MGLRQRELCLPAMLRRRSRLVNFRLTEDEYSRLHTACVTRGALSISDFARAAVLHSVGPNTDHSQAELTQRLGAIESNVGHLNGLIERLVTCLVKSPGGTGPDA